MKKINYWDFFIISILVLITLILIIIMNFHIQKTDAILIKSPTKQWIYPLNEPREIIIEGPLGHTTIQIANNQCYISEASCHDKRCMQMRLSSYTPAIVCLPNKLVIQYYNPKKNKQKFDGIAQ